LDQLELGHGGGSEQEARESLLHEGVAARAELERDARVATGQELEHSLQRLEVERRDRHHRTAWQLDGGPCWCADGGDAWG
jgi:hypothetical protein